MKIALCFIISNLQILNKEEQWIDWIEPNSDIINIYFHYSDYSKIQSSWIKRHAIPQKYIVPTSYLHVVPAYISLLNYAFSHNSKNKWFCLLTDSCVPIISPLHFRELFFEYYNSSIFCWKKAWWNLYHHKRANLRLLQTEYHLANDPWFVLNREDVNRCLKYVHINTPIYTMICKGGLANESIFAIILQSFNRLMGESTNVINSSSHIVDWSRMTSATSPHIFKLGDTIDITFIVNFLKENKYTMFLRKVHPSFPNAVLNRFNMDEDLDPIIKNKRIANIKQLQRNIYIRKWEIIENNILTAILKVGICIIIPVSVISYYFFTQWMVYLGLDS
jgi:hypothetical protein